MHKLIHPSHLKIVQALSHPLERRLILWSNHKRSYFGTMNMSDGITTALSNKEKFDLIITSKN